MPTCTVTSSKPAACKGIWYPNGMWKNSISSHWTIFKLKPGKDVMWINVPKIIPKESQKPAEDRMNAGEKSQKDIERHVDEWIAKNTDKWNGWLAEARKAAK